MIIIVEWLIDCIIHRILPYSLCILNKKKIKKSNIRSTQLIGSLFILRPASAFQRPNWLTVFVYVRVCVRSFFSQFMMLTNELRSNSKTQMYTFGRFWFDKVALLLSSFPSNMPNSLNVNRIIAIRMEKNINSETRRDLGLFSYHLLSFPWSWWWNVLIISRDCMQSVSAHSYRADMQAFNGLLKGIKECKWMCM